MDARGPTRQVAAAAVHLPVEDALACVDDDAGAESMSVAGGVRVQTQSQPAAALQIVAQQARRPPRCGDEQVFVAVVVEVAGDQRPGDARLRPGLAETRRMVHESIAVVEE